ncbi:S-adenosyl-l-methionine hydroxide adenosyltransferase family protein [cf. Phormidesmis sp. LEGE 11477]|uniref:SAM hydrolase/SAM-dependent halogenase family protein n=1 Tax=cf. Phormidesmis sp. LEGE 11477 TaxID=1828680 RepID=UPI00187E9DD4|nr:SAM-dependent chlorinase/fluorinase [cf. Phormidesmis sp. LEGE 11477]MBE9062648.1 SAM-dependent chlorinase/fluorinase [cf. Phormidesmis sp. LEGE 11477]
MITLLSDFGLQDAYVAVMRGVIASIAPGKPTCDLTHQIPPQDILAARFNLMMAYPHFPEGTVHLAVVDPGVGSNRRAIALQYPNGFLVGPDNGLLGDLFAAHLAPSITAVSLTNAQYWRVNRPSHTFHGRDIFAPAAAHLANGVPITALGDRIDLDTLVQPNLPPFRLVNSQSTAQRSRQYAGSLQYIDRFGNLISNIPGQAVSGQSWQVELKTAHRRIDFTGVKTYADVPIGSLCAVIGGHGWLEIACNCGSAAKALEGMAEVGTLLSLTFCD